MKKKFLLMGTDVRQQYLKEMLEQQGHHTEWIQTLTPVDAAEYDAVLLPVSDSRAYYDQVADSVHGGQLIFGCNLPKKETGQNLVENVPEFVEYMQEDDTAYHNAVATAEGAVAEAILHSTINLCGAKSLLIGYGRCGKVLADRLMRMYSRVTVAERKESARAQAEAFGFDSVPFPLLPHLQKYGKEYAYIFNTVPKKVLTSKELENVSGEVTIIDIASRPGGTDFEYCRANKMNAVIKTLTASGMRVIPIFSENVQHMDTRFGKAEDFRKKICEITGEQVIDTIAKAEPIGPKSSLDALVIAPCTGNTIAKLAAGITDTPVLMAAKAHLRNEKPLVISISTNDALGMNFKNIGTLMNIKNIYFVPFGQDNYEKKHHSMIAHVEKIPDTIEAALQGKQIQPVIASPF